MLNEAKAIGKLMMNTLSTWAYSCRVSQGLFFVGLTSGSWVTASGVTEVSSRPEPEGERPGSGSGGLGSGSSTLVMAGVSLP